MGIINHLRYGYQVLKMRFKAFVALAEKKGRGRMRSKSRGPSNRGNHRSSSSKGKFDDVEVITATRTRTHNKVLYDMVNLAHGCDFGVVRMGNTRLSRIAGIGDICLKFDTGMELVLHNVKHVPDMRLNIISTGLLDEDGYHNSSGNGLWKVTLGSLIVARGKRESKLYMTHPKISKSIVNAIDNDDMTELWHKRLGHMSEKRDVYSF
ncbi:retrovirus-related pol polyprotein from transposon TNT 1-94 [Tanacetum coccineum]